MDLRGISLIIVSVALVRGYLNTTSTNVTKQGFRPLQNRTKMADLTQISWAHAVNSRRQLDVTLKSAKIDMIEADVMLGKLPGNGSIVPIMAHPPYNTSDLSLHMFLLNITHYNSHGSRLIKRKGIKLDFKSVDAFNAAQSVMSQDISFPPICQFWLNADILKGPSPDNKTAVPVNPDQFLEGAKRYNGAVLSLGWTTSVDSHTKVAYTAANVDEMHQMLSKHRITQDVTFAVRAGVAAESSSQMKRLLTWPNSTLTIWLSNSSDPVSVYKLKMLIREVGRNRTYLDVPAALKRQLVPNSSSVATYSFALLLMVCLIALYQQFLS